MINLTKIVDYTLVYLLVAMSGIPFFYRSGLAFLIPATGLSFITYVHRKRQLDKLSLGFMLAMLLVCYVQMVKFQLLPVTIYLGIFLRIFFAYFTLRSIGHRFFNIFITIVVTSSIISYFFYFPSYIPGVEKFLKSLAPYFDTPFRDPNEVYVYWPNFIVYNINTTAGGIFLRNSGPFWEPGAHGGYLILAYGFNLIITKELFNRNGKLIMFALLTTFSTTAYISFMVLITFYVMAVVKSNYKIFLLPVILVGMVLSFTSFDFLGEKIKSKADIDANTYNTRFTSAVLDLTDTMENPLVGLGRTPEIRFKGSLDAKKNHRNNGVTGFLVNYGVPFFLLYFFLIFYGYRKLCMTYKTNPVFGFYFMLLTLLIGFSEMYYNYPFFMSLPMLGAIAGNSEEIKGLVNENKLQAEHK